MDNIKIQTTHGYTVIIRPFLTYDQYIEIQKIWTKNVFLDVGEETKEKDIRKSMAKVPANTMYEANKLAVKFLVFTILEPDGAVVKRQADELPVPPADGSEIMDVVNRISTEASDAFNKKKAKT